MLAFRQTATFTVESGVVLKFKPGRGIYAKGNTIIGWVIKVSSAHIRCSEIKEQIAVLC